MHDPETLWSTPIAGLVVALGIGLLIGVERERRKGTGPQRKEAGVRTFALVALLGAIAGTIGSIPLLAVLAGGVMLLAAAGYLRAHSEDPGLTTEIALLVTYVLGVLANRNPGLAAGLGVLVALLLASRSWLHDLVSQRLSDREVFDGILLAGSALIVLPLLPDRAIDPYGVVNPQVIWRLTVLVLLINAFGYVALRALGTGSGLQIAGFFGGFVSSAATIASMGGRGKADAALLRPAIAGAALSSVATVIQLALVLAVAYPALLLRFSVGLILMGGVAAAYAAAFTYAAKRAASNSEPMPGRAFQPRHALIFAITVTTVLFLAAWLADRYGSRGATIGIGFSGFADSHSATASAARLLSAGALPESAAVQAILLAVTANTLTKAVIAWTAGGWRYARALWPGLILMLAALALGAWFAPASNT